MLEFTGVQDPPGWCDFQLMATCDSYTLLQTRKFAPIPAHTGLHTHWALVVLSCRSRSSASGWRRSRPRRTPPAPASRRSQQTSSPPACCGPAGALGWACCCCRMRRGKPWCTGPAGGCRRCPSAWEEGRKRINDAVEIITYEKLVLQASCRLMHLYYKNIVYCFVTGSKLI